MQHALPDRVQPARSVQAGLGNVTRDELLDFAPLVGLDILDDSVGQFTLTGVAWCGGPKVKMFLCQSQVKVPDKSLAQVKKMLKAAGWSEDVEARRNA